eukprot:6212540-Pleurochrysis_carterae.AAC.3
MDLYWSDRPVSGGEIDYKHQYPRSGSSAGAGAERACAAASMRGRSEATSAMRTREQGNLRAERERSASTHAMPMQTWETVLAGD